jgi:hypothetical protein
VAGRGAARGAAGGGEGIQATRQARARLIVGGATALAAAALATYAALEAERLRGLLAVGGVAATAALAAAVAFRLPRLAVAGLVLLGAEYAGLFLVRGSTVDQRAPLYGAGFLVVSELAFGAMERRAAGTRELALVRVIALAALALAAVALGTVVLAVAALPAGGGIALHAVGVAAAVALVLLLGRLAVHRP